MSDWVGISVVEARGSTPREPGTTMRVWPDRIRGTIGGGALEWQAIHHARGMLAAGTLQTRRSFSLGPELGQCCGGSVVLEFANGADEQSYSEPPLWIWGAGHVGRAIADVMAPFGNREIMLIDVAEGRFPDAVPLHVTPILASDPSHLVPRAPQDAEHLIVTYSHDLDLKLCDALLRHGFGSTGLIGSATKWARFRKRLSELGHEHAQISRICCPIGQPELGKHPQAIAIGVASALLNSVERQTHGEGIAL